MCGLFSLSQTSTSCFRFRGRLRRCRYLWLYWKYIGGGGAPTWPPEPRRLVLRPNILSGDVWGLSIFAGLLGLATLFPLLRILGRMVLLPAESQQERIPPQMSYLTVFMLL